MSSNYLQNLKNELEAQFLDFKGTLWNYSTNNKFEDDWLLVSPIDCIGKSYDQFPQNKLNEKANHSFGFEVCDENNQSIGEIDQCIPLQSTRMKPADSPQSLVVGHSYKLYEEMYKLMISAEELLDITTLTAPTEEFLVTMTNALTYLSHKPENKRPLVRIAYSQLGTDLGLPNEPPRELLSKLCEKMDSDNKLDIYVLCLEVKASSGIANRTIGSWNHAKIMAADGKKVITGGHNLYGEVYLHKFPVFDVSLKITGESALHAHDYANQLWRYAAKEKSETPIYSRYNSTSAARIFKGSKAVYETVRMGGLFGNLSLPSKTIYNLFRTNKSKEVVNYGTVPMLAIGREALLGVNSIDAEPSDTILIKAISLAKKSIKLSVQTLEFSAFVAPFWDEFLIEIAKAMIERDVKVKIIMSSPKAMSGEAEETFWDNYNGNTSKEIHEKFYRLISENIHMNLENLPNLSVIPIHLQDKQTTHYRQTSEGPDGVGNHAKTLLIDDILFYIGSQNFYQNNLNEFGYFIESQQLANQYNVNYWNHLLD